VLFCKNVLNLDFKTYIDSDYLTYSGKSVLFCKNVLNLDFKTYIDSDYLTYSGI